MVMMNDMDRYHLVMDVIDRTPEPRVACRVAAPGDGRHPPAGAAVDPRPRRGPARGPGLAVDDRRRDAGARELALGDRCRVDQRGLLTGSGAEHDRDLSRDRQLLVRSAPPARRPGELSVEIRRAPSAPVVVAVRVEHDPQRAPARAGRPRAAAASCSPTPAVNVMTSAPPQHRQVGADVLAEPVAVDVVRRPRPGVPGVDGARAGRGSRACPARPCRPERWCSRSSSAVDVEVAVAQQVQQQPGVEVAGTGAHDQALQRGEAHRRVDRSAAADRRRRGAVAQVQHDLVQLGDRTAEERGRLARDVLVADPVRAVPPDRRRAASSLAGRTSRPRPAGPRRTRCRRPPPAAAPGSGRGRCGCRPPPAGCAGARAGRGSSISARTSSSTTVGTIRSGPPCTTRCPIAVQRRRAVTSWRAEVSRIASRAASWSGTAPLADALDRAVHRGPSARGVDDLVLQATRIRR